MTETEIQGSTVEWQGESEYPDESEKKGSETAERERHNGAGPQYLLSPHSEQQPVISVVMPTLNEEEGIADCIERIEAAFENLEVPGEIIVSDSSTDRTPEIAREMGAQVVHPDEPGYGYAYQFAFRRARGEYIAIGDADTTYDFGELPKLFRLVASGEADMAMGSRLEGEILPGSMPALHQYVGNPLLTRVLNGLYGVGVSDAHSGMRVFTRDALDRMELRTTGMEFASEMIMEAGAKGLTVEELPITYHPRKGEATLESFRDGWRHVRFMLVNAPGFIFSVPGTIMGLIGIVVMGAVFFDISVAGIELGIHTMIMGSLLLLVGQQAMSLGVFSNLAGNPVRTPDDPFTQLVTDHVTLERGATVGVLVFGIGAFYALASLSRWITSGFTDLPILMWDIVALTAIVLGLQIIFGSFFLNAIAER